MSMDQTAPLCPLNVPSLSPLWENHTEGRGSFEQEKSKSPSLLNFILVKDLSCPCKRIGRIEKCERKKQARKIGVWSFDWLHSNGPIRTESVLYLPSITATPFFVKKKSVLPTSL